MNSELSSQSSLSSQNSTDSSSKDPKTPKIDVTTRQVIQIPRNEDLSPSKKSEATGKLQKIIYIEVHSVNGGPFEGELTKVEAKGIWKALGQNLLNVERITIDRNRFVKIGYELRFAKRLTEISCKQNFNVEFTRGPQTDIYKIKLTDYDKLAVEIGDIATISITNTGLEVTSEDIGQWMSKFGDIIGEIRYEKKLYFVYNRVSLSGSVRARVNLTKVLCDSVRVQDFLTFLLLSVLNNSLKKTSFFRSVVDSDGIGTDDWTLQVKLNQHIPELLPINGRRSLVYYPGIPKQCKNCYETGHIAPVCQNTKED